MKKPDREVFYVGSFTKYLYVMELDAQKGEITVAGKIEAVNRPAYLLLSEKKDRLYVANEYSDGIGGVSAYDLADKYRPRHINTVSSGTCGPAHVSLASADGREYLLSAEFFDGRICAYPVNSDGSLAESCCTIQLYGSGPFVNHPGKYGQEHARAHYIVQVPGTRHVLCTDLGTDKIYIYSLLNGRLTETGSCRVCPGSGPRHIALGSGGEIVYLINELSSTVAVLDFDREKGELKPGQYISALPEEYGKDSWCSAIRLSGDGRFLYGLNRGHDSIAIFSTGDNGRRLTKLGYLSEKIGWPRDFQTDPSGRYMLVANQGTDTVSVNRVDGGTGMLEFTGEAVHVEKPAYIEFI